jgi:hypothetical protein
MFASQDERPQHDAPVPLEPPDPVARTAAAAFTDIARTMDGLRSQIEGATAAISQAVVASAYEVELGRLFLRAQAFLEDAVGQAEREATQVVAEARAEAAKILDQARRQAGELVAGAGRPALAPESLQHLERTLDGFTRSNAELSAELGRLLGALSAQRPTDPLSSSAAAPPTTPPVSVSPPAPTLGPEPAPAQNGHTGHGAAAAPSSGWAGNGIAVRPQPPATEVQPTPEPGAGGGHAAWELGTVRSWLSRLREDGPGST